MIQIAFTPEEMERLHPDRRSHPDPQVRQRWEIVYLQALGYSHQEIGEITRVSQPTVRDAWHRYQEGGLEKLKEVKRHQPTSELEAPREVIEAIDRIEKLPGLRHSPTQVRHFLKSLGMKRLKAGSILSKADGEEQAQFLEKKIEPRWEKARQGKRQVFFVDGAHNSARCRKGYRLRWSHWAWKTFGQP